MKPRYDTCSSNVVLSSACEVEFRTNSRILEVEKHSEILYFSGVHQVKGRKYHTCSINKVNVELVTQSLLELCLYLSPSTNSYCLKLKLCAAFHLIHGQLCVSKMQDTKVQNFSDQYCTINSPTTKQTKTLKGKKENKIVHSIAFETEFLISFL